MSDRKNRRILIVDDNEAIHEDFRKILGQKGTTQEADLEALEAEMFGVAPSAAPTEGYEICSAYQGQEALEQVKALAVRGEHYALAFVDMRMPPGWDGVQTIAKIWEVDPEIQVVICTAYSDYSWEQILTCLGSSDRLLILKKPFDIAEVCQLACALTEKWHLARRAHLKLSQLKSMVEEQTQELKVEIAQRVELEFSLRESETRYALAAASANDGLWDWDLRTGAVYYSARWRALLGLGDGELRASPDEWFGRVHPDDLESLQAALSEHLNGRAEHFQCEYRIRHQDAQFRWMLCRGLAVRDASGHATRVAGSQTDITDRRMAEEQLRHEALHDALTGLPNRALLSDRLRQTMLRARRSPDQRFAVLFLDLDHFKTTNDTLGHLVGDQLLMGIAKRLVACVRSTDSVAQGRRGDVARLGGDEFVVLLEGLRDEADAIRCAARLQATLREPMRLEGKEVRSTFSIGIAFGRTDYENPDDILRDADTALYQAKADGRDCYAVFNATMHAAVMSRWWLETELRSALARDELRFEYQPVRSLSSGELCELEALLRWNHRERGSIPPAEFIPVAEQVGLMVPLGKWALRHVVDQLERWASLLEPLPSFALSVNISGKQIAQPEFVEDLTKLLQGKGMATTRLRLEVTESALMAKSISSAALQRMRELDLRFHLDDFGTGYSSLSYLHRIPVGALKVDLSFVQEMTQDPVSVAIVESVILLAHALGARAIAEGVETKEQVALLCSLGCDLAQGYYFSPPLELDAATALLRTPRRAAIPAPARPLNRRQAAAPG